MNWSAMPPLPALRSFAAFAQTGGVQSAGVALNVSHAAISQQIKALETHMGLSLVDRSGRAMALTADGIALADALSRGFATIFQTVEDLTGRAETRPLHITTTTGFAASWLMPRLPGFRVDHPGIDFVIAPQPDLVTPQAGGVDLAIRYGDGSWEGVEVTRLMRSPLVGVASPDLVGATPPGDAHSLSRFPWLQDFGTHEATGWLQARGLVPEGGFITAPGNLTLDAARSGLGIAVVARLGIVEQDLASGRLVQLFEHSPQNGYWMVTRRGVHRPALKAFMRWLRREAGT